MMQNNAERALRENEVIAVIVAKLVREGADDQEIKFLLNQKTITSNAAAEAFIRSGIGEVPIGEILEYVGVVAQH